MKVRIVKDWDHPNFFRQTPGGKGFWEDIYFTDKNILFCDLLTVLNVPNKDIYTFCRKEGRWLLSQEPPHSSYRWQTNCYGQFDRIYTFWDPAEFPAYPIVNAQTSLPWHVNKSYDELVALGPGSPSLKKDGVSWITSSLNTRPGHAVRLRFIDFLRSRNFPFELYGRGFQPIDDKFDGIFPFKYSIAIENFSCNDYWTEKIADCFLSWTMPIYYGALNITDYFPERSIIRIDPNDPEEALRTIGEAIAADRWSRDLEFIKEARELVLDRYQFFPSIAGKIKKAGLPAKRKFHLIRKP